jgi:hypothetical protein
VDEFTSLSAPRHLPPQGEGHIRPSDFPDHVSQAQLRGCGYTYIYSSFYFLPFLGDLGHERLQKMMLKGMTHDRPYSGNQDSAHAKNLQYIRYRPDCKTLDEQRHRNLLVSRRVGGVFCPATYLGVRYDRHDSACLHLHRLDER